MSSSSTPVRQIQRIVFDIMCDIDDFCKENGLLYFLSGGTCLGAVRHHGFIPWDDDGDLMAPRDDYERFKKTFPDAFKDKYEVGEFSLNKEWSRPYIRVWDKSSRMKSTNLNDVETGVFVDVFPIDGLPNGAFARKVFYMKAAVLVGLGNAAARTRFLDGEKHIVIKTLASVIARPFGKRFFTTQLEKLARKYPFYKSEYVAASMASHYGEKETILRSLMSSPVFQEFEGRAFPIPSGYDTYLSNLYGNYMEIPKDAAEKGYTHLDHYEFGQAETSE